MTSRALSLVGMPGSGKSTVGRHLSRHLGLPFVDADHAVEARLGETIRAFFESRGEPAFRAVEQQVLGELMAGGERVIATGGGAVLRDVNREALRRHTTVVYLRSTPEDLYRRLRHDTHRPLLQVGDPLGRLRELFRERDPLYRRCAHFVIETARPTVPSLVNMILMQLELAGLVDAMQVPSPVDPRPLAAAQHAGPGR